MNGKGNASQRHTVPIISGKAAVLRIYPKPVQSVTKFRVDLRIREVVNESRNVVLQPPCTPADYRRGDNRCQSIDFFRMTATDQSGNTAYQSVGIVIADAPPTLELMVEALDTLPTTCVEVAIDAQSNSPGIGLDTVEYSLDGGITWTPVPVEELPFRFILPGSGFFHLVARAFDTAGQLAADDTRFFTDAACDMPPPSPPGRGCTEQFGNAPGFVLCEETAETCSFNANTNGGTCDEMCRLFGSQCVGALDNEGSSCMALPGSNDTCQTPRQTEICICAR